MDNLEPSVDKNSSREDVNITTSGVVFEVSNVPQPDHPLPEVPYYKAVEMFLNSGILQQFKFPTPQVESCCQYRGQLIENIQFHPVVAAIHIAFSEHRPLCLSPDIIWLLIIQGFAQHINANSESLRSHFINHETKLRITIQRDDFVKGSSENPWDEFVQASARKVREYIGEENCHLLTPRFSTTGFTEQVAAEITLLDAMQSFFFLELLTRCGIPKIRLDGTSKDWQTLLNRTKRLAQFDLHWWIDPLVPVLEQFIVASQGQSDQSFWRSIYKFDEGSGGTFITGWITAFFPYLQDWKTGKTDQRNDFLNQHGTTLQPPSLGSLPSGLSRMPFRWHYLDSCYDMELLGGFLGVKQEQDSLFIRPEIGWAVRETPNLSRLNHWRSQT